MGAACFEEVEVPRCSWGCERTTCEQHGEDLGVHPCTWGQAVTFLLALESGGWLLLEACFGPDQTARG